MKRSILVLLLILSAFALRAQTAMFINNSSASTVCNCWRVQVQRLSYTDASKVNYHEGLEAIREGSTWRIVSNKAYTSRARLQEAVNYFRRLGYRDAFPISGYCYLSSPAAPIASPTVRTQPLRSTSTPKATTNLKAVQSAPRKPAIAPKELPRDNVQPQRQLNRDTSIRDTFYQPRLDLKGMPSSSVPDTSGPRISTTVSRRPLTSMARTVASRETKPTGYNYRYRFSI